MAEFCHENEILWRVFIVGCPRSGTTLLQSIIASHPQILSFPEDTMLYFHFMSLAAADKSLHTRLMADALRAIPPALSHKLNQLFTGSKLQNYSRIFLKLHYFFSATDALMMKDILTCVEGKNIWLEKVPNNIRYISTIQRHVNRARFIHILRNGKDVVASLYNMHKLYKHEDAEWSFQYQDATLAAIHWKDSITESKKYVGRPGHLFIAYTHLVDNPRYEAERICRFLEIDYSPDMVNKYNNTAKKLIKPEEHWKRNNLEEISRVVRKKSQFHELLTPQQQEEAEKIINCVDLGAFARVLS